MTRGNGAGGWKAAACGCRSFAVIGRGNKEDNDNMSITTNGATEEPQPCDNHNDVTINLSVKDKRLRLTRGGGNKRAG
jgi:hypothetical protein